MRFLLAVILTMSVSCSTIEDDRICLDWESRVVIRERCIPMYGTLICADQEKVETWCVLYEEPLKERSDMRGKHVVKRRREGALERLQASTFFEKNGRTEQQWQKRKDKEIERLEIALGLKQPAKKKREEIILD